MKIHGYILAFSLFLTGMIASFKVYTPNKVRMTVFIHGICHIDHHLNPAQIIRFFRDESHGTYYESNLKEFRDEPFFYQNQAMGKPGLHRIESLDAHPGNTAGALGHIFETMYASLNSTTTNQYYTFGWSGMHSPKEYRNAGKELFKQLEQEVNRYRACGIDPEITIIGYSHGGNVALSLGAAHQDAFQDSLLKIDHLVLLAPPFGKQFYQYINDDVFRSVYNIYSHADKVQRIDMLAPDMFLCSKKLQSDHDFELPKKLKQIRLKVTKCARGVFEDETKFSYSQDYKKPSILNGRSPLLKNMSPGHIELFFFGWTLRNFRQDFILYPLPAVCLLPYIMHHINQLDSNPHNHFIFDYRPHHGTAIIMEDNDYTLTCKKIAHTLSYEQLETLKQTILQYQPDNYTPQTFVEHVALVNKKTNLIASTDYIIT